ncbi:ABC transporter substrate-binding protein [Streptomyces sp. ISL-12]|uniref:ABC transporter substrate-binding protein n=1 Tax=Streptomyces sp. ISL-12 TaxID=2819177 RepID=UPI001BE6DAC6|nr:ABC transporter substrate-binding protein [Streptomyces sp. ISL-12]MBT2414796.1 ABC transporter substrate-binding protein [Streptomyces sp. ISL-12]
MRRAGPALALAGLLIGALGACGGPAGAEDGGDTVTLRVGATGWKREEALLKFARLDDTPYRVRWSLFQGGDKQLEAVRAGALDVASSSEIPPVFAAADGRPGFKVVAVQHGNTLNQEVVVPEDSDVTSVAKLKGKKVGYVKNTTAHYFLYALLQRAGLGWDDITAAPLEPDKALAALNGGSLDAFAGYGNAVITAHQRGARTIGDGADVLSGNFLWSASDDTLGSADGREALADLLARIDQAYAYVRDGRQEEYAKVVAAATHQPVDEALEELSRGEAQRRTEVGLVTAKATASQQQVADAFVELGALRQPLEVAAFWTHRLDAPLRKALSS